MVVLLMDLVDLPSWNPLVVDWDLREILLILLVASPFFVVAAVEAFVGVFACLVQVWQKDHWNLLLALPCVAWQNFLVAQRKPSRPIRMGGIENWLQCYKGPVAWHCSQMMKLTNAMMRHYLGSPCC